MTAESEPDWRALRTAATAAMHQAYAPYSRYPVGAAALVDDGRIISGCNVENASYGLTLCAECGMISQLIATGGGRLLAVVCVDSAGVVIMPCGRCRQLIFEHSSPQAVLLTAHGVLTMTQMLPQAFGPQDLAGH